MFTDIPNGSLYRLEGWELVDDNHDLSEYRSKDLNWETIKFEGYFLDPKQVTEANQDFTLQKYIRSIVDDCYDQGNVSSTKSYVLFFIPQNCESIIEGDGFPDDPNSFSSDDDGEFELHTYDMNFEGVESWLSEHFSRQDQYSWTEYEALIKEKKFN